MEEQKISPKSRLVALLLVWFFGVLGIHRMYVGKVGSGVLLLIATLTYFGLIVSAIVALIDFIQIIQGSFKDKDNLLVKKWAD